jgi:hypothetical protein
VNRHRPHSPTESASAAGVRLQAVNAQAAFRGSAGGRGQPAETALRTSSIAVSGRRQIRFWLRSKGVTRGVHSVHCSASSDARKISIATPQYSEVPTQPVRSVASRTALRHSALARSIGMPALQAYQGRSFGVFMLCSGPFAGVAHAL